MKGGEGGWLRDPPRFVEVTVRKASVFSSPLEEYIYIYIYIPPKGTKGGKATGPILAVGEEISLKYLLAFCKKGHTRRHLRLCGRKRENFFPLTSTGGVVVLGEKRGSLVRERKRERAREIKSVRGSVFSLPLPPCSSFFFLFFLFSSTRSPIEWIEN